MFKNICVLDNNPLFGHYIATNTCILMHILYLEIQKLALGSVHFASQYAKNILRKNASEQLRLIKYNWLH